MVPRHLLKTPPLSRPPAVPAVADSATTTKPSRTVTLPDVVGQNGAIAKDTLHRLGLTRVKLAADPRSGKQVVLLPANWTVTKLDPPPGTQVRTDQVVVLTMTK